MLSVGPALMLFVLAHGLVFSDAKKTTWYDLREICII